MKRGEVFTGTVTEKHTILDLKTGRTRRAIVVRADSNDGIEDWLFVAPALWNKLSIEGLGNHYRVEYGLGRLVSVLERVREERCTACGLSFRPDEFRALHRDGRSMHDSTQADSMHRCRDEILRKLEEWKRLACSSDRGLGRKA